MRLTTIPAFLTALVLFLPLPLEGQDSGRPVSSTPTARTANRSQAKPDSGLMMAPQAGSKAKPAPKPPKSRPAPPGGYIDINGASKEQLNKLPGITDAFADKIIAGRPYSSKSNLVTRGVIPDGVYYALKGRIVARRPASKR